MGIFEYFARKQQEKDAVLATIKEHRELTQKAIKVTEDMIAALDGECGWFECVCSPKKGKVNDDIISGSTHR